MVSIFKKNSIWNLTVLFLLVIILLMGIRFANGKESLSSEQNMENIQILAGAIDVEGGGISITLTDDELNKHEQLSVIHDVDLIKIVNLLTAAGAEVISINDERLISTSKIKANKMMIKINNSEYNSPFIIKVIGDPDILIDAVNEEESYINLLKEYVEVKIKKEDKLFIPKYGENIYFKYAKSVKKDNY